MTGTKQDGAGHPARLPQSGRAQASARIARDARSTCASTPRPAACWGRASVPGSFQPGVIAPLRGWHGVRVQVCASTPRPAARWSRAACPAPLVRTWSSLRADVTVSAFRFAHRRRILRLAGAGPPCPAPLVRTWSSLRADVTVHAFRLGIDAASCGSHREAGYAIDAGVLPATLGRSGCW